MEYHQQLNLPGFENLPRVVFISSKRLKGAMVAFRRIRVKREIAGSFLLNPDQHWQRKAITTKSGKTIITYKPSRELKKFQWKIVRYITRVNRGLNRTILPVPNPANEYTRDLASTKFATAFSKSDSIVRNALAHLDMRSSVSFDLRRAFESIKRKHLQCFLRRLGFPDDVAWVFSKLLTYKGRLQRGASCSAHVFNLLLARLDKQITEAVGVKELEYLSREWADKKGREDKLWWYSREMFDRIRNKKMAYTRYGDDICVSSAEQEFPPQLIAAIRNAILSEGFQIRDTKTRICQNGVLELPGVVIVGNVVRPRKSYLIRLARLIAAGSLTQEQLHGHLAFICSFPRRSQKGAYSFLKKTLGNGVNLLVFRRPYEPLF